MVQFSTRLITSSKGCDNFDKEVALAFKPFGLM
jgi:hypothetical protein